MVQRLAVQSRASGTPTPTPTPAPTYVRDIASATLILAAGTKKMRAAAPSTAADIVKPSDQVTGTTIGWAGQNLDREAALTFKGGDASVYCKKLYDQSGNANDLTQAIYAQMLSLFLGSDDSQVCFLNGRRSGVNVNTQSLPRRLMIPPLMGTDRNNLTVVAVLREISNYRQTTYMALGNIAAAADIEPLDRNTYYQLTPRWDDAGTSKIPGFPDSTGGTVPSANLCVSAFRSTGSAIKVWRDTASTSPSTNAAVTSRELDDGGQFGTSNTFAGQNNNEVMALLIYRGVVSDSDMANIIADLRTIYLGSAPAQTHHVFFQGDSITEGIGCLDQRNLVRLLEEQLSPAVILRNWGQSGITAASMSTYFSSGVYRWIPQGVVNVMHFWGGTNDIGPTADPATIWGSIKTAVANYKARCSERGVTSKVVIGTIIPRNDTTYATNFSTNETVRNGLNALIRANDIGSGGPIWDGLADFDADSFLGNTALPNNTTYYGADKLHPTEAWYALAAPIAKAALNAAGVP